MGSHTSFPLTYCLPLQANEEAARLASMPAWRRDMMKKKMEEEKWVTKRWVRSKSLAKFLMHVHFNLLCCCNSFSYLHRFSFCLFFPDVKGNSKGKKALYFFIYLFLVYRRFINTYKWIKNVVSGSTKNVDVDKRHVGIHKHWAQPAQQINSQLNQNNLLPPTLGREVCTWKGKDMKVCQVQEQKVFKEKSKM